MKPYWTITADTASIPYRTLSSNGAGADLVATYSLDEFRSRNYNETVADVARHQIINAKKGLSLGIGNQDYLDFCERDLDHAMRNVAVAEFPLMPHSRDPETDTVIFDNEDDEIWFRLKYL